MKIFREFLISIAFIALLCGPIAIFLSLAPLHQLSTPMAGGFSPTGGGTYLLQSSISSTQNTITLTSFLEPGSNIPYTMNYIGTDVIYGTIAPSTGRSEFVSATGITQNSNGTATLTGVIRGESRTPGTGGCVASTTLASAWPGQTQFILSDSPCFFSEYATLRNNQTFSGISTFSSTTPPRLDEPGAQATGNFIATTSEFATVAYVNAVSFSGGPNASESAKGVSQFATQLQSASSTISGSTGAGLVLQSKYATSSPGSAGLWTVVTDNAGKIAASFLNGTEQYIFNGIATFNGGLTATATTTIPASSASGNALILNGVKLAFPSSACGNGTAWIWNGSGTASCGVSATSRYVLGTTTSISAVNGNVSSVFDSFPAGSITASSTVTFQGDITCTASAGTPTCGFIIEDSAGNSYLAVTAVPPSAGTCVFPFNGTIVATSSSGQISDAIVVSNCASANAFHDNSSAATTFFNTSSITGYKLVITSSNTAATTALTNLTMVVNP